MKGFLCLIVLLIGLLAIASAKPQSPEPKVNYLRYKNDAEVDSIVQSIIAQYQQLGGSSEFHNVPASGQINVKK